MGGAVGPRHQDFITIESEDWIKQAHCNTGDGSLNDLFFPPNERSLYEDDILLAKRICGSCAVKATCLEYAISNRIKEGIWGGTTESERRAIWKRLRSGEAS